MNSFIVLACIALVASASASGITLVGPGTHGTVLQGPSAKASLVGPDGSHIVGAVHGGTVVAPPKAGGVISASIEPGYIAHTAPVVHAAPLVHAAPVVPLAYAAVAAPILAHGPQPGDGHEGQYVHDYTEKLYDDGSYKGEYYGEHY